MNREVRRRQQRQARLVKNAEAAAKKQHIPPPIARAATTMHVEEETILDRLRARTGTILIGLATVAVIAIAVWFFAFRGKVDTSDLNVTTAEDLGQVHLSSGEVYTEYNTDPPTSGPHDPSPVPWGVYVAGKTPFPTKENLVHNMEHGGAIIWYRPSVLTPEQLDTLTRQAAKWVKDQRKKVIVVPWETLPEGTAVAATVWTKLMKLESFDMDKIDRFVSAFEGPGPENIPFTDPVILPPGY